MCRLAAADADRCAEPNTRTRAGPDLDQELVARRLNRIPERSVPRYSREKVKKESRPGVDCRGQPAVWPATRHRASMGGLGSADGRWRGNGRADGRRQSNGRADQAPVRGRELRYDSWEFRAASDLSMRLSGSPPVSALIGSVVRDPALIRVLVAVWRLPVVDLQVRRADADIGFGAYFRPARRAIFAGPWAQAVLELPTVEDHYLAGRSKQALRTNLRHARDLGVTSDRLPNYEAWFEAASVILDSRCDGPLVAREMGMPEPGQQVAYYVARDADETPLAYAGVALFGQFACLFTMFSHLDRQPSASWARYQLHTFLALDLGRSGVKHLLVGSALRQGAGNQYFQQLLGYRVCNLRVEVIESDAT